MLTDVYLLYFLYLFLNLLLFSSLILLFHRKLSLNVQLMVRNKLSISYLYKVNDVDSFDSNHIFGKHLVKILMFFWPNF